MKSRILTCISAMTLFAALAIPAQLAAQDDTAQANKPIHHHYKLIDTGTFGGPQSFTQDLLHFQTKQGVIAGWADTSAPDPNYPNSCAFWCGPFIDHAFQWNKGVLTDMGALPGVNTSAVYGISENGLSVGISENGAIDPLTGLPEAHAVLWKDNQITDLGTLGGGYESVAFAVNNRGQVAGVSWTLVPDPFPLPPMVTEQRPFLWQDGVMQDLGTLGGPDAGLLGSTGDVEMNERGQVVACSYTNSTPNPVTGVPTQDPFLWDKESGMQDLGSLGGTFGCAININNRGQVIGYSDLAGDLSFHPFLWDQGAIKDLGTFGGDGLAISINEAGEAVGWAWTKNDQQLLATLWRDGMAINLGTLSSLPYSNAQWINSREQIVGFGAPTDFSVHVAFLWENGGPMVDLNTLIPPDSNLLLAQALHINDRGEITGDGVLPSGDHHAFVLIPCDENHPGIEGCDYSLVERSTASSTPATQRTTSIPDNAALRHQMLRSFGRRWMPWYRGLGASTRD